MFPTEDPTNRYAPYFSAAGYVFYLLAGLTGGFLFEKDTFGQAVSWQIGSGAAIWANVLAGIWLARRGEDLAAAGFTMLAIVYGVYFTAIVVEHVDMRAGAAAVLLMVPAQILITFCRLLPVWVKIAGVLVCVLFVIFYVTIVMGTHVPGDVWQVTSYIGAQALGIAWAIYFLKTAKHERLAVSPTVR